MYIHNQFFNPSPVSLSPINELKRELDTIQRV